MKQTTAEPRPAAGSSGRGVPGPSSARFRSVFHLLAPAPFGGLEQVVRMLSLEQARAGLDVHVAAVLEPDSARPAFLAGLEASGVRIHAVTRPHRRYLRERRMVRDLLGRVRPDVVHTHGYHADVLHGTLARRMGLVTVSTVHGFTRGGLKNRVYEQLQRRSHRRSDAVVVVSRPMMPLLRAEGVPGDRLHCVPNALMSEMAFLDQADARRRLGIDGDPFLVGFIGRLSREKGPDTLVDALATLDGRASAVIIGDGPLRGELEARAAELELDVRWAGVLDDAARLIPAMDLVVLSSRTEGTPMVLLEAMAAGVPVVATAVGGVPDVVTEREAVLVPPDDPARLGAAIAGVIDRPGDASARAAAASERLRAEFGSEGWVRRYSEIYEAARAAVGKVER